MNSSYQETMAFRPIRQVSRLVGLGNIVFPLCEKCDRIEFVFGISVLMSCCGLATAY